MIALLLVAMGTALSIAILIKRNEPTYWNRRFETEDTVELEASYTGLPKAVNIDIPIELPPPSLPVKISNHPRGKNYQPKVNERRRFERAATTVDYGMGTRVKLAEDERRRKLENIANAMGDKPGPIQRRMLADDLHKTVCKSSCDGIYLVDGDYRCLCGAVETYTRSIKRLAEVA